MKKLRNSVLHSGTKKGVHTRLISTNENNIIWVHWVAAVYWDRQTNSRPMHYKVTDEHLHLDGPQNMANHLAEDMLDDRMLFLMIAFQQSFVDGTYLK